MNVLFYIRRVSLSGPDHCTFCQDRGGDYKSVDRNFSQESRKFSVQYRSHTALLPCCVDIVGYIVSFGGDNDKR